MRTHRTCVWVNEGTSTPFPWLPPQQSFQHMYWRESRMLWSSVEPVSMETVASKVESSLNGYLMIPDALSLAQSVTKQHAWLHTLTHLSVFCHLQLDSLLSLSTRSREFLFSSVKRWIVFSALWTPLRTHITSCLLCPAGCFSWALLTSAHLADIRAQLCRMPCDRGVEHELFFLWPAVRLPLGCTHVTLTLLVEDFIWTRCASAASYSLSLFLLIILSSHSFYFQTLHLKFIK